MSTAGLVTLSDLIDQVRSESDQINSQFVTDLEVVTYISNSYKELYDLLISAYGEDYYVAKRASFLTDGNLDMYPLPDGVLTFTDDNGNSFIAPPFYKLLGLDYQLSPNNPQGYITLKTFPFSERNRFSVPNFASFYGFTNLRYRLAGNNLFLTPIPAAGQPLRLYYIPRPVNLVNQIVASSTISTNIITTSDVLTPQVGMQFFGSGVSSNTTITAVNSMPATFSATFSASASTITVSSATGLLVGQTLTDTTTPGNFLSNTTITSIVGTAVGISNSTQGASAGSPGDTIFVNPYITLSTPVLNSTINNVFKMFSYTQTVDGISGWEEYVVIDGAGKILAKEESDVTVMGVRKDAMIKRIEGIAANRDPGSAAKTADVATGSLWDGGGEGNNGFGGGSY